LTKTVSICSLNSGDELSFLFGFLQIVSTFVYLGQGYLRITDFGIARVWREENAQDTSGTPGYMAPEVMCRLNHTVSVDYFAVGVMAFECMYGRVS
jgi:serine/threonine protein kinase